MPIMRAVVVVPADNQLPADSVVNNWGINFAGDATASYASVTSALAAFYTPLLNYLSSFYVWAQADVRFYNLEDPPPRVPTEPFELGLTEAGSGTNLPQEVALCMSFRGAQVSGANMARRRGRLYLGPWAVSANNGSTGRPTSALLTAIQGAGDAFLAASDASAAWSWCVISSLGEPITAHNVVAGWVDDAWDTQRRRGNAPNSRLTFAS